MSTALVVLAILLGPQAAEAVKPAPLTVQVETPAKAGQDLTEWAGELRRALETRKDEFRLAKPGAKAELVVRLDAVGPGADGTPTLKGTLVRGEVERPFTYTFASVRADAQKLARNLRKLADQTAPPNR